MSVEEQFKTLWFIGK